nr:ferredoxin--NADP reductase [Nonomuraea sp. K271]
MFGSLVVEIDGREVRRAYSATSVPGAKTLTLTVKRDGLCSSYLNDRVRAGARMRVRGPSGTFHVAEPAAKGAQYVLIAAGSGITPMMSIIRTVLASSPDATITLLYGNRTEADIIFARQLAALCKAHPGRLTVHHVLSKPAPGWRGRTGRIGPDLLRYADRAHYYVCGPAGMLTSVRETLTALGVPPERLHEERFATAPATAPATAQTTVQTMTVEGVGEVMVAAEQTLLDAGLAAGVAMSSSCTVGSCGEGKVNLLRGDVETMDAPGLEPGEILACASRPLTEVTIATAAISGV